MAIQFLQTSNSIATPEQLALVRMDANIPRYGQLKKNIRVNWLIDQIMILNYLRHVKEPNEYDILIDAGATDDAIMESADLRILTQVEIQDAFKHGINGDYGEFYGITSATLIGFLKGYQKSEKWQKAKAIVYAREKEAEMEKERKFQREMYEARLKGFKMPFWPTTRGKKGCPSVDSEEHRRKIRQQAEEILKNNKEDA